MRSHFKPEVRPYFPPHTRFSFFFGKTLKKPDGLIFKKRDILLGVATPWDVPAIYDINKAWFIQHISNGMFNQAAYSF